jgi:hypothetical protein
MVYALQKVRLYLLGKRLTFYVNHLASVYLMNKPQVFCMLVKWLL